MQDNTINTETPGAMHTTETLFSRQVTQAVNAEFVESRRQQQKDFVTELSQKSTCSYQQPAIQWRRIGRKPVVNRESQFQVPIAAGINMAAQKDCKIAGLFGWLCFWKPQNVTNSSLCSKIFSLLIFCMCLQTENVFAVSLGDRVQTTANVVVRQTAGGTPYPTGQSSGALGVATSGPQYAQINGTGTVYEWWYIDFDSGQDGWVAIVNCPAVPPAAPTLIGPGSGTSVPVISSLTPTFSWNAVRGATGYGLYVEDASTSSLVYNNDSVGNITSLILPAGTLQAGKNYIWNMRASDSAGYTYSSGSSGIFYFQTPSCSFTLSPTYGSFDSSAANSSVSVTTSSGCSWTANNGGASWITITSGSSGTGSGTVYYSVAANTSTSGRTANMTIAGQTFTVVQSGQSCSFTLSPTYGSFDSSAANSSVTVTTSSGCSWTANNGGASWITITSGSSGTGSETVYYSVAANTSTSGRTADMNIAGQIFTVVQSGENCSFTLSPTYGSFDSSAANSSVSVSTTGGCNWSADNGGASWITITSGSSGSGSGTVYYSVAANTGTTGRTADMNIAGKTFTVVQSGENCSFTLSPTYGSFDSNAANSSVTVTTSSGCSWSANNGGASWITITSGSSGTGSGTVYYSVAANTGTSGRTADMTIAGQTFTVVQSAGSSGGTAPTITTQPQSQTVQSGANVTFTVVATGTSLNYQWRFNPNSIFGGPTSWQDIPGAAGATLTKNFVSSANAGLYSVRVWNSYGSTTSDAAQLTVSQPLDLTQTSLTPTTDESTPAVLGLCPISSAQLKVFNNNSFTTAEALDPGKMTIVLTHGWNSSPADWPTAMASLFVAKGFNANIVAWDWSCAASTGCDPSKAAGNTPNQGIGLAQALTASLGPGYAEPIHFIGHSLGTLVNAAAANYLTSHGFSAANLQMTLFDEASVATFTDCEDLLWLAALGNPSGSQSYLQPLPTQFRWADNYISLVGNLHPNAVNVILTNGLPATASGILDLISKAKMFHAYPYSWYEPTITSDISTMGDEWSFERGGFSGAPTANTYYIQNGSGWNLVETTYDDAASVVNSRWQTYHNAVNTTGAQTVESGFGSGNVFGLSTWGAPTDANIILHLITSLSGDSLSPLSSHQPLDADSGSTGNTSVPAYAWIPLTIPSNALFMSFDFLLNGNGQNDSLAVALDGTNVLSVGLSLIETNVTLNSGPIDVSEYAGQQVELFAGVVGATSTNASVTVSNLQFYVELPPTLHGQVANNNFSVSWPLLAQNVSLQTTTNLADPNSWMTLTNTPAIVNLQNTITNPISDAMRFYRAAPWSANGSVTNIVFSDNFSGDSIDSTKWTTSGNTVLQTNQTMEILTTVTDAGGSLTSVPFPVNSTGKITISRQVFVHYGYPDFEGEFTMTIGSLPFSVRYANMTYSDGVTFQPCYGFILTRNNARPDVISNQGDVGPAFTPLWDTWFNEKVTYDPASGVMEYFINNVSQGTYNVGVLPQTNSPTATLFFSAWGWFTGHQQLMQNLVVSQTQ